VREINFKGVDARVRFDGSIELILICTKDAQTSIQGLLDEFKENVPWVAKIAQKKARRSLEANSYMWILCDKIAEKIGTTKELIYKDAVENVGVFTQLLVQNEAVDAFIRAWNAQGLGNHAMAAYESKKNPGNTIIIAYHGSSTYDTQEMSRLVDYIVQEAQSLGIDTMTPDELERLKTAWK
jgi:hypothetical protein